MHGINEWSIEDYDNEKDLQIDLTNRSIELMNSYSCVAEILNEDLQNCIDEAEEPMTDEEIDDLEDEIYLENVDYNYWELDEEAVKEDGASEKDLEEMLYNDPESFLEMYRRR
jgi:hypothetical protein